MIQNLFSVPVIMGAISSMPDQGVIEDAINAPTMVDYTEDGLDHADPKDRRISKDQVIGLIDEMTQKIAESTNEPVEYESHWVHVHHKNMSTNTHSHLSPGNPTWWSAACYLQVPENSGKICFVVEELGLQASISPKKGRYVIFPSKLKHYVTAHGNDIPRVCLSVNWRLKNA